MRLIPAFVHSRISHRPNLVKIVDNIGWLFVDKVLRMGVGLFVGVWIARYLGPEQFGLLSFALAFTGLFGAFATMGLQGVVVRDIVNDPDNARLTMGSAIVLQSFGGVVSFILIITSVAYLRPDDFLARDVVSVLGAMMLLKVSDIAVYWFESQVKSKYTVWVQNSVFLIFAVIKVYLILFRAPIIAFAWAMLAEAAISALILFFVMGLRGSSLFSLHVSMKRTKTLLQDSWPLILTGLAVMLYMRIDQIMIGQMLGDEEVGVYSAAVRISEVLYFIPIAIVASVFPAIIEAKKQSEEMYRARLQKLYDLMVLLSVAISLPMTFLAKSIVILLFGQDYDGAGLVLSIHIWASVFVFLGVASGKWFLVENRPILNLQRTSLGALVNVILNVLMIPRYGYVGAAYATVVSQFTATWLFDYFHPETRTMFFMKFKAMNPIRTLMTNIFAKNN